MKEEGKGGSIDFEFPETKIILDDKGIPVEIRKEERRIANRIIEEFMLVCNETIAEEFFWAEIHHFCIGSMKSHLKRKWKLLAS